MHIIQIALIDLRLFCSIKCTQAISFGEATINTDAELYFKSAQSLLLPVKPRAEMNGFELKISQLHYLFYNNDTPFNVSSSAYIATDKYCSNTILARAGIPVPKMVLLHSEDLDREPLEEIIAGLRFPLVIKPNDGSLGMGVLCNIKTIEQLAFHLKKYCAFYPAIIIEEFYANLKSYRVLVFKQQVIGVVLCLPASVCGDGEHTIQELIELANRKRKEISAELGPIRLDEEAHTRLEELDINEEHIPAAGETIVLGYTSNPARGGSYESLGVNICKENRKLMSQVAAVLNLELTGIDIECTDINLPFSQSQGIILEVNYRPSMLIHEKPINGKPQAVTKKIMRSFIFRHPLAYVYSLYANRKSALFIRAILVFLFAAAVYWFIYR